MGDDASAQANVAAAETAACRDTTVDGATSPTDESASAASEAKKTHAAELAELTGRTSALMLKDVSE